MTNYSDEEIREWARMADRFGGRFVRSIDAALLSADDKNFALLNFAAVQLVGKYPKFLEMAKADKAKDGVIA